MIGRGLPDMMISPAFLHRRYGLALLILAGCTAIPAPAQTMPANLKKALTGQIKFTPETLNAVESGKASAHVVETGDPEDVFIAGAVRFAASPVEFVNRYRNVTEFESGPGVPAGGKFSAPPVLADMSSLAFIKKEIDDIKACKPGKCEFKIGDRGLARLQSSVNWNSPDYTAKANDALRSLWLEYLKNYMANGNEALAVYHDSDKLSRVAEGLEKMVANLPALQQFVPEMNAYLTRYPQGKPPDSEEFFYWQVADFGLKPVHRVTHVIIQKKKAQYGDGYLIANKMLYASHYFRSALELRFLIPAEAPNNKPATYLVVLQRSYVDGMTGFTGKILRKTVMGRSRDALERYLTACKGKVEGASAPAKK
jgi:hypothetical protein